jgi:protein-disulfide isomerase
VSNAGRPTQFDITDSAIAGLAVTLPTQAQMPRIKTIVSVAVNGVLVFSALVLAAVVIRREFLTPTTAAEASTKLSTKDWERASQGGQLIGPVDAAAQIVVFSDFECPFCQQLGREAMAAVRRTYPNNVAFRFRHFPLKQHRYAYAAARAAECAAVQGRFEAFHDSLFANADSIGKKSFAEFAVASGVKDRKAFEVCSAATEPHASVQRDIEDAKVLLVAGTPTIFANGWRLHGRPDSARLDSLVGAAMAKRR